MFNLFNSFSVEEFDNDPSKPFHNAAFANGIFQKRTAPIGTFITAVEKTDFSKYGLTKICEPSFEADRSEMPKIPNGILAEVIHLYREIYKTITSEVYCAIVWDKINKDYFIHVPVQQVSSTTIKYTNTKDIYDNPNYLVVMDIHSHNVMDAFFSSVDLADEMGTRFFGVIGKIDNERPSMVVRAATNGEEVKLQVADLFDFSVNRLHADSDYSVPTDQYSNITERAFAPTNAYASLYEDWDSYYPPKKTTTTQKTTYTTPYGAESSNPYVRIYSQLNMVRYGKNLDAMTAMNFLETAVECTARYLEDLNADELTICDIQQQLELLAAFRFNSAINAIHGTPEVSGSEVEFTSQPLLGLPHDNSTLSS